MNNYAIKKTKKYNNFKHLQKSLFNIMEAIGSYINIYAIYKHKYA